MFWNFPGDNCNDTNWVSLIEWSPHFLAFIVCGCWTTKLAEIRVDCSRLCNTSFHTIELSHRLFLGSLRILQFQTLRANACPKDRCVCMITIQIHETFCISVAIQGHVWLVMCPCVSTSPCIVEYLRILWWLVVWCVVSISQWSNVTVPNPRVIMCSPVPASVIICHGGVSSHVAHYTAQKGIHIRVPQF